MEKLYCVYMHTSPSGKAYIGITNDYKTRCKQHQDVDRSNCTLFAKAIKKYGWDSFDHVLLADKLTLEEANDFEDDLILLFESLAPHGYNARRGGSCQKMSDEVKQKISKSHLGKKMPEGFSAKMSEIMTGKKLSEETRAKMSIAQRTRIEKAKAEGYQFGQKAVGAKRSEETKAKMRATWAKKKALGLPPLTDEQRKKYSDAHKNPSQETRNKISAGSKAAWEIRKKNGTHKPSQEAIEKRVASRAKNKAAKKAAS